MAGNYTYHINTTTTLLLYMSKELSPSFCEVCGVDVGPSTDLRRFGKLFCSLDHMNQYTKAREKERDLGEEYHDDRKQKKEKGWRRFLRDFVRGCC